MSGIRAGRDDLKKEKRGRKWDERKEKRVERSGMSGIRAGRDDLKNGKRGRKWD